MKKILLGFAIGAIAMGATGYTLMPKMKQAAYNEGLAAGRQQGVSEGTAAGMAQGREEAKAEYARVAAMAATAAQERRAAQRRAAAQRKPEPKPIQNWHVIGNQIADPIVEPAM